MIVIEEENRCAHLTIIFSLTRCTQCWLSLKKHTNRMRERTNYVKRIIQNKYIDKANIKQEEIRLRLVFVKTCRIQQEAL